jgi:hypothetical protein
MLRCCAAKILVKACSSCFVPRTRNDLTNMLNKLFLDSLAFVRKFRSQLLSAWLTPF